MFPELHSNAIGDSVVSVISREYLFIILKRNPLMKLADTPLIGVFDRWCGNYDNT